MCSHAAAGPLLPAALLFAAGTGAGQRREPLGLVPVSYPADNPYSPAKAELGRLGTRSAPACCT